MEAIFDFVEVFICVLEAYLMFDFFMAFFPLRKCFQRKYVKVAAVVMTAVCVRLVNCLDSSMINFIGMLIIYLSLLLGMFCGNMLKKIACYIVAFAIMMGSEFLWIVLMALPSDFSMGKVPNNQITIHMTLLGVKLLAFVLFNIVKRVNRNTSNRMDIKNFLLYSVVPIASLGIIVALAYFNIDFNATRFAQVLLIISGFLVVIGNILIFSVFDRYVESAEKLRQQELVITRMELEEKRYEQIETVNQEHAGFLHDIKHYMRTIGELAVESKENEIVKILSELQIKVSDAETKMYCPNRMLNTILNEKMKEADEKHIKMKLTIEPEFMIDQIENMDLIVIMGNLLDNAIEAAQKCEQGYVNVYLFAQNNAYFSVLKIVNNFVGEVKTKDDRSLTCKEDKSKHGFGIQNVIATAEKYNGYLNIFHNDGTFTAIVILPNSGNL